LNNAVDHFAFGLCRHNDIPFRVLHPLNNDCLVDWAAMWPKEPVSILTPNHLPAALDPVSFFQEIWACGSLTFSATSLNSKTSISQSHYM
jgi:hypothetical protein